MARRNQPKPACDSSCLTSSRCSFFLSLTSLESYLPDPAWYPLAYLVKVLLVTGLLIFFRGTWRDLSPRPSLAKALVAVVIGLVVFVLWVGLEGWYPVFGFLGTRTGLNPRVLPSAWRGPFIAVRLFGLVLGCPVDGRVVLAVVPDPLADRSQFPQGCRGPRHAPGRGRQLGHLRLLPSRMAPCICTGLLGPGSLRTKSLSACVISHAVANLALGVYVLTTGDWKYW